MWRKFLGVGIPLLMLGLVFYIIAVAQATSSFWGGGDGWAALSIIGLLFMLPGFMLVNAGLIGAAVGAERVTEAIDRLRRPAAAIQNAEPAGASTWQSVSGGQTGTLGSAPHPVRPSLPPVAVVPEPDVAGDLPDLPACPGCGTLYGSDTVFCGKCGRRVAN